ncbi:aspartate--ammonia ligase [Mycoplasma marinum]|uniref:Aspartate--ammonia ligase n=1 Tax=Mycoplasma marinum TaxID=1937190 RepID=A0A4R0XPR1_9MOLU|nr:aspartate--ammonia ligase [Mycoplasma marinum]TCG11532.1 aspartate--ammonia ligase [Mycoplasma marinum]
MTIKILKKQEQVLKTFEEELKNNLSLIKVQAPLFVTKESRLNDSLNAIEKAVSFKCKQDVEWEVVHSLAKWKRAALWKYDFPLYEGLVTHMKAIRKDEELDETHSYFVEQWDWEKVISKQDRNKEFLKNEVSKIYKALKATTTKYSSIELPEKIFFIDSIELEKMYPTLSRKEREDTISKIHKVVFIMGIGWELEDGKPHDGRAPDYDDWELNGDLLVWFEPLKKALELSSMGIRVSEDSIKKQLSHRKVKFNKIPNFHQSIIDGKLPYTIGGGIGQTRVLMYVLGIKDIKDVQLFNNF